MQKNEDGQAAAVGEIFSRVYSEKGEPVHDSILLRRRLGAYVQHDLFSDHWKLSVYLKKEVGIGPRCGSNGSTLYHYYEEYFEGLKISELLNVITLTWRFLTESHQEMYQPSPGKYGYRSTPAINWLAFVRRVFTEENLGYVLDERCGVRYSVDEQFDLQRESTLQSLKEKKYAAALAAFEDAHRHFSGNPRDRKAALRSLFESIEITVKLMVRTDRLTAKVVSNELKEIVLNLYGGDAVAQRAIGRVVEGFADWVDGMHNYRHGQGEPEPVTPPETFTIYAMSSGAAFLRWIVHIDKGAK